MKCPTGSRPAPTLGRNDIPIPQEITQPAILALLIIGGADQRSNQPADSAPPLAISGKAAATVAPAGFYAFTPTVNQRGDRKLEFTIANKPEWASFGQRRGTLYGSPNVSQTRTYSNIIITVSDGESTVQLPPFAIQVGPQNASTAARHLPAD